MAQEEAPVVDAMPVMRRFWVLPGSVEVQPPNAAVAQEVHRFLNGAHAAYAACRGSSGHPPSPGAHFLVALDDGRSGAVQSERLDATDNEQALAEAEVSCLASLLEAMEWPAAVGESSALRFTLHYR